MDETLKNVIFHGPHMPGIDLNPVHENLEKLLKTDLVQPTPTSIIKLPSNATILSVHKLG